MSKCIKISDFEKDERNFNRHNDEGMELIEKSMEKVGWFGAMTVSADDKIPDGNARHEIACRVFEDAEPIVVESDGKRPVIVRRTDIVSGTKEFHELALLANTTARKNIDLDLDLIQEIAVDVFDIDVVELGVDFSDILDLGGAGKSDTGKVGSLNERFIVQPFSILDCKSGKWQERKNAWLALGIKSEIGRDENLTFSSSAQTPRIYEVRNKLREKTGSDPSWDDVFAYCKANNIPLQEGTSIFDPVLCELIYRWFNVLNGTVLDPFAGGSVRGIVAAKLKMPYNGVDLREEQIQANYKNAKEIIEEGYMPCWACGDSVNIDKLFVRDKYDLVFSCPPYADLEVYSDDPRDLSNMDYDDFIKKYREIINKTCSLLNDNRFAVFVVGEVRDKTGVYYNFVADTINAFRDAGLSYYNEMILATQIGSAAVRTPRQFNASRKVGKIHQNVLVFYKGDVKQIKHNFPELDFSDDDVFTE